MPPLPTPPRPPWGYTIPEIVKLPCMKCGAPSSYGQWEACASGPLPLCADCDIAANQRFLEWVGHPETTRLMRAYRAKVRRSVRPGGHFARIAAKAEASERGGDP